MKATWEQTRSKIDVLDWSRGLQFAPLLLPCATAEVSRERGKGITRLILYFLRAPMSPEVDDAITCLCSLASCLAFLLERDLVENGRVSRVAHKAKMKEEDGTIFCNKHVHPIASLQESRTEARAWCICIMMEGLWMPIKAYSWEERS